jgi:hypothetical protein
VVKIGKRSLLETVVVKFVVGAKSRQGAHSHTVGEEDLNARQDKHQSLPVFGLLYEGGYKEMSSILVDQ